MKTSTYTYRRFYLLLSILVTLGFAACKKDNNEGGKGAPTISRVRTISKTFIDHNLVTTITTYNDKGIPTITTFPNTTAQLVAMDSTTTDGNLQNMYAIIGTNLGSVVRVSFNGLTAYFNKALGSDTTILVSIPKNTPAGPAQSNLLEVETLHGTATFKFNILLPPPTVATVSDLNFSTGSEVILNGIGLGAVTAVQLVGTADMATIVAKEDSKLILKMPATAAVSAALKLTYSNGSVTTTQSFVNLEKAYQLFTDDYGSGWSGNFWGSGAISTEAAVSGTKSLKLTYAKGNYSANGVANWDTGLVYSADYKFLSFYIKGGSKDYTLYITGDKRAGGYGNSDDSAPVVVPANVWTYFKIPLSTLDLWKTGTVSNTLGFWIKGPDTQDESFYIDDLILVK